MKKSILIVIMVFVVLTGVLIALIPYEKKQNTIEKYGQLAIDAETDEKAKFILDNADIYPVEMLKSYNSNQDPENIEYIYNYVAHRNDYTFMSFTDEELNSEKPPKLYMYDYRWCYEVAGGDYIKEGGCALVSLTMAYIGKNHTSDYDPVIIGQLAEQLDVCGFFGGVDVTKMKTLCEALNFDVVEYKYDTEEIQPDEKIIKEILDSGHIVLLGMNGELFGQHALLITDYSEKGFEINDPASEEKSSKIWTFEELKDDIYYIWDLS